MLGGSSVSILLPLGSAQTCPRQRRLEALHNRTGKHPSQVAELYRSCPGQGDGFNDLPKSLPLLSSHGGGILTQHSPQGSRHSPSIPMGIEG